VLRLNPTATQHPRLILGQPQQIIHTTREEAHDPIIPDRPEPYCPFVAEETRATRQVVVGKLAGRGQATCACRGTAGRTIVDLCCAFAMKNPHPDRRKVKGLSR
jgi:hypothetical protein